MKAEASQGSSKEKFIIFIFHKNIITIPAVVDFPTPPFADETTMIFLTPGIGHFLGKPRETFGADLGDEEVDEALRKSKG